MTEKYEAPQPDAIISVPTPAGSKGFGPSLAQITFAHNLGMTKAGTPRKAHQISINVEALNAAIANGSLKVSKSGFTHLNFVTLTDEIKAKMKESAEKRKAEGSKTTAAAPTAAPAAAKKNPF